MDPLADWNSSRSLQSLEQSSTSSLPAAYSFNGKEERDRPIVVAETRTSLRSSSLYNPIDPTPSKRSAFKPPQLSTFGVQHTSDATRDKLTTAPQSSFYSSYGSEFGTPEHTTVKEKGPTRGARTKGGIWGVVVDELGVTERDPSSCAPGPGYDKHNLLTPGVDSFAGRQVLSTRRSELGPKMIDDRKLTCLDERQVEVLQAAVALRTEPGAADYTIPTTIGKDGVTGHEFGRRHKAFQSSNPSPNRYYYEHREIQYDALGRSRGISASTLGTDPKGKSTFNSKMVRAPRAVMDSREPRVKRKTPQAPVVVSRGDGYRTDPNRWLSRVRAEVDAAPSVPPLYSSFGSQKRSGNRTCKGATMGFLDVNHSRLAGTLQE